jgi:hypothetical protein
MQSRFYPRPLPAYGFIKNMPNAGFEPNFNIFVCMLSLVRSGGPNPTFVQLISTDPPSPLNDPNLIKQASGLYGGQTFTFITPQSINANYITIYLGNKITYDVSVCLDDLLYAFSTIGGPLYTSHKKKLPDETVVENPDGTVISLVQVEFWVSSASGWIGTDPNMLGSGLPTCTLSITQGTMQNYSSELEMAISAVRLENNSKTVAETTNG